MPIKKRARYPTGTFRSEIYIFDQMLDIEWIQEYDSIDGCTVEIYSRDPFTRHFLETLKPHETQMLVDRLYDRTMDMQETQIDYEENCALDD